MGNHLESEDRGCVMKERGVGVTQRGLGLSGDTRLCTSRLIPRALWPHPDADWTWENQLSSLYADAPLFLNMSDLFRKCLNDKRAPAP